LKVTKIYISSPEKHKNLNLNLSFRALKFSKFSNASKLWNFLPTLQVLPSLYSVVVFPAVRIKNLKKHKNIYVRMIFQPDRKKPPPYKTRNLFTFYLKNKKMCVSSIVIVGDKPYAIPSI